MSVLVADFERRGLNHDELETLRHEFGHVLHGVLSTARHADLADTSVKRDFVEVPSQIGSHRHRYVEQAQRKIHRPRLACTVRSSASNFALRASPPA
jgi:hypothetical protein